MRLSLADRPASRKALAPVSDRPPTAVTDHERLALVNRAIEHTAEPMAILSHGATPRETRIIFANRAFLEFSEWSAAELFGSGPQIMYGDRTDRNALRRLREKAMRGEPATETLHLYTASGVPRLVEIRARPMEGSHRIVSFRDLTRYHASQQALLNANRRLNSLIENNTDGVVTLDTSGKCIGANPASAAMFGLSREDVLGYGFITFAPNGLFPNGELFPETLLAGRPMVFRATFQRLDGIALTVDCKAIPVAAQGGIEGAYLTIKDVSEAARIASVIAEQAKRTRALCLIGAVEGSDGDQIDAALHSVIEAFDMQFGYVGEIIDGHIHIRNVAGDRILNVGARLAIEDTYVREMLVHGDTYPINDIAELQKTSPRVPMYTNWHAYISAPLHVNGRLYGAIGFLARRVIMFNDSDNDFVSIVAALVSVTLERQAQKRHLDRLAYYDALTGLPNRTKFIDDLEKRIERARSDHRSFALHFVDLDGFKSVNDNSGHAMGDLVLQRAGARIRRSLRHTEDVPARLGGDEFVVLQADVEHPAQSDALANRIVSALSKPFACGDASFHLGASVGSAIYPDDGRDVQTLLRNADAALYRAKHEGKGRAARAVV